MHLGCAAPQELRQVSELACNASGQQGKPLPAMLSDSELEERVITHLQLGDALI